MVDIHKNQRAPPITIEEDEGCRIELANDENRFAIVSKKDLALVQQYKWARYDNVSRKHTLPIISTRINNKNVQMHHLILGKPATKYEVVIHKNNDELDNRRTNIMYVSRKGNFRRKYENTKPVEGKDTRTHPVLSNYRADKNGNIFNCSNNKMINGTVMPSGYNVLLLKSNDASNARKARHVFVYECFNGLVPEGYEIDHIDRKKINNKLSNLQCLSVQEHRIKTAKDNPDMPRKVGAALSKPIIAKHLKTLIETKYNSLTEAALALPGTILSKICAVVRGRRKTHQGYEFRYQDVHIEYEEEYWVCLSNPIYRGIEVSNLGRVKNKKRTITSGRPHNSYMRISVCCNGRSKLVFIHQLICEAFHGHNPDPNLYTVDHIDRNRINNHESNLRWATKQQQMLNSTRVKSVLVYDPEDNLVGDYCTVQEASKNLNIDRRIISRYCKNEKTYNGYNFKYKNDQYKSNEITST
jgi:hypothetical protein